MSVVRWWAAMAVAAVIAIGAGCDADRALHRMQERERPPAMAAPAGVVLLGADAADAPGEPVPVTRELLARGEDRYDRACAACHGVLGDGDTDVARAMQGRRPGSLVDAHAVQLTDAQILSAIAVGYGAMPALADVLPAARDRAAVLHFVRALQLRDVAVAELPAAQRAVATRALGGGAP